MSIAELANACMDSIRHPERSHPDNPLITLVGRKRGLFPKKGWPRAKRLLCVNPRNEYVYHYDAANVLAALAAHGLIEVKFGDPE